MQRSDPLRLLRPPTGKAWWRYPAALGIVVVSTGCAEILFRITESTRLSMVFLAGVLVTAFLFGSGPAYLAAAAAFLVYNFYLVEPRFTFTFEAEDAITLAVFLAVAMLTGLLTGRIRDEAKRADIRTRATRALLDATRDFSASSDEAHICARLAHHLAEAARGQAVVRTTEGLAAEPGARPDPAILAEVLTDADPSALRTVRREDWHLRPLIADGAALGVAAWRSETGAPPGADEEKLLEILVDTGASAISRAHLSAGKADAETRARTEVLRNALLSSISHDLRTPLAAIMASASSLHDFGHTFEDSVRTDLAATIQEEAVRLDSFVANLLNMTRLEAGQLAVQQVAFSVPEVLDRIVSRRTAARGVLVDVPPSLPDALGDPALFEQAVGNVLENAVRYTGAAASIAVTAQRNGDALEVEVVDEGPGVPEAELESIFEKFYRCDQTARIAGTGLGLSITRGLVEGMGGTVRARNRPDGRPGLAVALRLPVAA